MSSEIDKRVVLENLDLIQRIITYEEENEAEYQEKGWRMAWEYDAVRAEGRILYQLFVKGILDMPYGSSGRTKSYCLKDREKIKSLLNKVLTPTQPVTALPPAKTDNFNGLFDDIIGYEDLKNIFTQSLKAEKPVHILLIGPPASAKTLFLMAIEKLGDVQFFMGGSTSKVGIRDVLIDRPRYLVIDEIDKIASPNDLSCLLSWMENGRVVIHKHNNHVDLQGIGWVFAAGNTERGIAPELRSRFLTFILRPYSEVDFRSVCENYLVAKEAVSDEIASYIATKLSQTTRDVRDAIKLARLCKNKEQVDMLIKTLNTYR